jgi:tetratricopeptide (TPR) repeat protein
MSADSRLDELRRRIERDPTSAAFAQLAEEYRRLGDHAEAVRICRTGLRHHPAYLSARVTLGRALIELGELDQAARELESVLGAAPDNLAAIRALEVVRQRRGLTALHGMPWDVATAEPFTSASPDVGDSTARDSKAGVLVELESWLAAIAARRQRRQTHRPDS